MSRIETYERIYLGEKLPLPVAVSRVDRLWEAIVNGETKLPFNPTTNVENYLAHLIDGGVALEQPTTRLEEILHAICTGEKADNAVCDCFNDRYLKYIYERKTGENMLVPNYKIAVDGVSVSNRTITLNGNIKQVLFKAQEYGELPIVAGDAVTIRYRYLSGELVGDSTLTFTPSYIDAGEHTKAVEQSLSVGITDYQNEKVLATTLTHTPIAFLVAINGEMSFDNLRFEVSFEKGDTTV